MKAAERKELETNYLADQLGRLVQGQNPHAAVWLAILTVGALVVLAYWAVPRQARERMTLAWRELWEVERPELFFLHEGAEWASLTATNVSNLAEQQRGMPTENAARFVLAQAEQVLALHHINDHAQVEAHWQRAIELYRRVLAETGLAVEMHLRAQLGLAQIAENRFWVEKARLSPEERERRWAQVLAMYEEALRSARRALDIGNGDMHPLVREIEDHLRRLKDPQTAELVFLHSVAAVTTPADTPTTPPSTNSPSKPE